MNRYAYRMEGLETAWNYIPTAHKITYTNLPPGEYTFHVKASNNDGVWNEEGCSLHITILPPFWRTPWAYAFYAVSIIGLIGWLLHSHQQRTETRNRHRQIQFEQQKEKEMYDSKIDFFTNIAHEIRTPLTLIKEPLEYLLKTDVNPSECRSNLHIMEKNTDRLLVLVNQLLDFREIESKGFSLAFTPTDIGALMEETALNFYPLIEQRGLDFHLEKSPEPCLADIDREAVTKVLSNLLSNAVKYARRTIRVTLSQTDSQLHLTVQNDGSPIPAELKDRIFDPFFQIRTKTASIPPGSGIGLALAQSLVELHGGHIALNTADSRMTSFVVSIPLHQQRIHSTNDESLGASAIDTAVSDPVSPSGNKRTKPAYSLLVVEDDAELLSFLCDRLEKQYTVHQATNGIEAISVLKKETISLIVSDVMMPQMDGFELCAHVKQNDEFCHIPVILLTAKTTLQSKIQGLESGADAYIEKPFSVEHLMIQIQNIFDNRRKVREAFANSPVSHTKNMALTKQDEQFLVKLTDVIHKHIANPDFNVDMLAAEIYMSRSSLLRKIKGVTELPPNDFIRLIRLKRSAELLAEGEYKINEVAYLVGFSSTSYFSKMFKKQFGILPKDFVKKK